MYTEEFRAIQECDRYETSGLRCHDLSLHDRTKHIKLQFLHSIPGNVFSYVAKELSSPQI